MANHPLEGLGAESMSQGFIIWLFGTLHNKGYLSALQRVGAIYMWPET